MTRSPRGFGRASVPRLLDDHARERKISARNSKSLERQSCRSTLTRWTSGQVDRAPVRAVFRFTGTAPKDVDALPVIRSRKIGFPDDLLSIAIDETDLRRQTCELFANRELG